MGLMEIVLIIIGLVAFVLGFLLPGSKGESAQSSVRIDEEDIRNVVEKEVEDAKSQITDIVDETITYAMEKTERSMDRLTNEKMLAVNEYSDTVLGEINKSHKEVVFLYDMLNDKHESLKATVSEAIKTDSEIKQISKDAEITAKEMLEKVREVQESVDEAMSNTKLLKENIVSVETDIDRQMRVETATVLEREDGNGFTPITAGAVESILPGPDVSVIGEESEEKPKSAGRKKKSSQEKTEALASRTESIDGVAAYGEMPSSNEVGNDGDKNYNDRILQLHKAGKSNMAIARELGLGIGEVKLVIDLFEGG